MKRSVVYRHILACCCLFPQSSKHTAGSSAAQACCQLQGPGRGRVRRTSSGHPPLAHHRGPSAGLDPSPSPFETQLTEVCALLGWLVSHQAPLLPWQLHAGKSARTEAALCSGLVTGNAGCLASLCACFVHAVQQAQALAAKHLHTHQTRRGSAISPTQLQPALTHKCAHRWRQAQRQSTQATSPRHRRCWRCHSCRASAAAMGACLAGGPTSIRRSCSLSLAALSSMHPRAAHLRRDGFGATSFSKCRGESSVEVCTVYQSDRFWKALVQRGASGAHIVLAASTPLL